jgi:hypothetical protein
MAWVSKFSGTPSNSILPVAGDVYAAGVFTIGAGTPTVERGWLLGTALGSANESPIAYETLSSMGANIANVLRVTARYASRSGSSGNAIGGGVALFGPSTDDVVGVDFYESAPIASPGTGTLQGATHENDARTQIGTVPVTANGVPHLYRVYWNGSGTPFVIPDAGFGSWSVAANTVSYWYSLDDGTTWVRIGDRAIAGGVAPTRAGFFFSAPTPNGNGDTVTFSNLEVMEETTLDVTPPVIDNFEPPNGTQDVDPDQRLQVDVTDVGDGLDVNSVVITVNGDVAWQSDAAQTGYSVTKTAISGGFHYSVQPDDSLPYGQVDFRVQADDLAAVPNSSDETSTFYVNAKRYVEEDHPKRALQTWYRNDFDGTKPLVSFAPYGTAVETGGRLQLTLAAGESGDKFYNNIFEVPYASFRFGNQPFELIEIESRLIAFTGSNSNRIAGMALIDSRNPDHSYLQMYYRNYLDRIRVERGIQGAGHVGLYESGDIGTYNDGYRFRIYIDRRENVVEFWFSTNNGVSWVLYHRRTIDFEPDQVILYIRQYSANPSIDAQFDFIEIRVGQPLQERRSPAPGTMATAGDDSSFPELVGSKKYNQEFSSGVRLPGPPSQQQGSIGPFEHGSVQDVGEISGVPLATPTTQLEVLTKPIFDYHKAAAEDAATVTLGIDADYADFKQDADLNYLLGGIDIQHVLHANPSLGSFGNPVTQNHWGAARNGKNYADGEECAPGGFGLISVDFNHKAWRIDGVDPIGRPHQGAGLVVHSADDTVHFSGQRVAWNTVSLVSSVNRWVLTADFDIEMSWSSYATAGADTTIELCVRRWGGGNKGVNQVYIYRQGNGNFYAAYIINGTWTQLGVVSAGAATSGKFRITRASGVYQCYYDVGGGWVALGGTISNANLDGDVHVSIAANGSNNNEVTVDVSGFTINSGSTSNLAGWAREAASATRGSRVDMPTDLIIVCSRSYLDLIDKTNNKLWMRFIGAVNNVLHQPTPAIPRRAVYTNGLLFVAFGREPTDAEEGSGILIDFAMNMVRFHREAGSTLTGAWYGGTSDWEPGAIAERNDARGLGGDYDEWQIQDYRVYSVDVFRSGGYEYRACATLSGMAVFKVEYQHLADNNWGAPQRSASTEASQMHFCLFDVSNGELFYMDDTNLYSIDKTTWEGVMPTTQVFTAATTKTLPSTRSSALQKHFIRYGTKIYVPADDGVYVVDWPSGGFVHLLGRPGEGAVASVIPIGHTVNAIAFALDGATPLLVLGLAGSETPLLIVNLNTNAEYARALPETAKTPTAVAV